jgi:hypothetical protein
MVKIQKNILIPCKVDCWGKGLRVCFELTFEDFEFRAAFTDRKNTPTFAAVMVKRHLG